MLIYNYMEFDIKKCYIYIVVDIVSNLSQIYVWRWRVSTLNNIQKTKNQHYVPRMYMKRFGYGAAEKRRMSVLFKDEGKVLHNQNPENYASDKYFYDVSNDLLMELLKNDFKVFPSLKESDNLKDEQFVEHALSREEGTYNQMLDEIEENPQSIYNDKTRAIFISFIHSLAYRTKKYRDILDNINYKTEQVLREMCDNMGLDPKIKKDTIKANCISGQQLQIENIISLAPVLGTLNNLLQNYNWYIAYNNTELDFIISDNPAQMVWTGFNDICIPISKRLAIILRVKTEDAPLISHDMPVNNVIELSLKSVIAYNLNQIGIAQRCLFGSEKAIDFMSKLNGAMNCMKGKIN